jgi:hypothetical protein
MLFKQDLSTNNKALDIALIRSSDLYMTQSLLRSTIGNSEQNTGMYKIELKKYTILPVQKAHESF